MMLNGAKFICIENDGKPGRTILAKGRNFTIGSFVNCDYVLEAEQAEKIHCRIECDAFGHVTIYNKSEKNPISVNGEIVTIKRNLFDNSKIKILDKNFVWKYPKTAHNVEGTDGDSTPIKQIGIPVQQPNSCPSFKYHRNQNNRFTVHNLRSYHIESDESNCFNESSNVNDSNNLTPKVINPTIIESLVDVTPAKVELVDSTTDKKTSSTEKRLKTFRNVWGWSGITSTSYSPREAGVRTEKTFTALIAPTTPNSSICRTPKGLLDRLGPEKQTNSSNTDLMVLSTPNKKNESNLNISQGILVQHKKSAMKIVDFTTPCKLAPKSPFPKTLSCTKTPTSAVKSLEHKLLTKKFTPNRKLEIADNSTKKAQKTSNTKNSTINANVSTTKEPVKTMLTTSTPYKVITDSSDINMPDSTQPQDDTEFFSALHSSSEADNIEESTTTAVATTTKPTHKTDGNGDELLQEIEEILNTSDELKRQIQATTTTSISTEPNAELVENNDETIDETCSIMLATVSPPPASIELIEPIIPPSSLSAATSSDADLKKSRQSNVIASVLLKAIDNAEKQKSLSPKEDDEKENKINKNLHTPTVSSTARRRISMSTPITVVAAADEINVNTPLTPKRITKRRPSIDEVPLVYSTHNRTIDHFNTENMGAIIEEEPNQTEVSSINRTAPNQMDKDHQKSNLNENTADIDDAVVMSPLQCLDESFAEPCSSESKTKKSEKTIETQSEHVKTAQKSNCNDEADKQDPQVLYTKNIEIQFSNEEAKNELTLQLDESFGEVEYLEESEILTETEAEDNQITEQTNITFEIKVSENTVNNLEKELSPKENSISVIELLSDDDDNNETKIQDESIKDKENNADRNAELPKIIANDSTKSIQNVIGSSQHTVARIDQLELKNLDLSTISPLSKTDISIKPNETVDLTLNESLESVYIAANKTFEDQNLLGKLNKTTELKDTSCMQKTFNEPEIIVKSSGFNVETDNLELSELNVTVEEAENQTENTNDSKVNESCTLETTTKNFEINETKDDMLEIEVTESFIKKIIEVETPQRKVVSQQEDPLSVEENSFVNKSHEEGNTNTETKDDSFAAATSHAAKNADRQSFLANMEVTQMIVEEQQLQSKEVENSNKNIQVVAKKQREFKEATVSAHESTLNKMEVTQMLSDEANNADDAEDEAKNEIDDIAVSSKVSHVEVIEDVDDDVVQITEANATLNQTFEITAQEFEVDETQKLSESQQEPLEVLNKETKLSNAKNNEMKIVEGENEVDVKTKIVETEIETAEAVVTLQADLSTEDKDNISNESLKITKQVAETSTVVNSALENQTSDIETSTNAFDTPSASEHTEKVTDTRTDADEQSIISLDDSIDQEEAAENSAELFSNDEDNDTSANIGEDAVICLDDSIETSEDENNSKLETSAEKPLKTSNETVAESSAHSSAFIKETNDCKDTEVTKSNTEEEQLGSCSTEQKADITVSKEISIQAQSSAADFDDSTKAQASTLQENMQATVVETVDLIESPKKATNDDDDAVEASASFETNKLNETNERISTDEAKDIVGDLSFREETSNNLTVESKEREEKNAEEKQEGMVVKAVEDEAGIVATEEQEEDLNKSETVTSDEDAELINASKLETEKQEERNEQVIAVPIKNDVIEDAETFESCEPEKPVEMITEKDEAHKTNSVSDVKQQEVTEKESTEKLENLVAEEIQVAATGAAQAAPEIVSNTVEEIEESNKQQDTEMTVASEENKSAEVIEATLTTKRAAAEIVTIINLEETEMSESTEEYEPEINESTDEQEPETKIAEEKVEIVATEETDLINISQKQVQLREEVDDIVVVTKETEDKKQEEQSKNMEDSVAEETEVIEDKKQEQLIEEIAETDEENLVTEETETKELTESKEEHTASFEQAEASKEVEVAVSTKQKPTAEMVTSEEIKNLGAEETETSKSQVEEESRNEIAIEIDAAKSNEQHESINQVVAAEKTKSLKVEETETTKSQDEEKSRKTINANKKQEFEESEKVEATENLEQVEPENSEKLVIPIADETADSESCNAVDLEKEQEPEILTEQAAADKTSENVTSEETELKDTNTKDSDEQGKLLEQVTTEETENEEKKININESCVEIQNAKLKDDKTLTEEAVTVEPKSTESEKEVESTEQDLETRSDKTYEEETLKKVNDEPSTTFKVKTKTVEEQSEIEEVPETEQQEIKKSKPLPRNVEAEVAQVEEISADKPNEDEKEAASITNAVQAKKEPQTIEQETMETTEIAVEPKLHEQELPVENEVLKNAKSTKSSRSRKAVKPIKSEDKTNVETHKEEHVHVEKEIEGTSEIQNANLETEKNTAVNQRGGLRRRAAIAPKYDETSDTEQDGQKHRRKRRGSGAGSVHKNSPKKQITNEQTNAAAATEVGVKATTTTKRNQRKKKLEFEEEVETEKEVAEAVKQEAATVVPKKRTRKNTNQDEGTEEQTIKVMEQPTEAELHLNLEQKGTPAKLKTKRGRAAQKVEALAEDEDDELSTKPLKKTQTRRARTPKGQAESATEAATEVNQHVDDLQATPAAAARKPRAGKRAITDSSQQLTVEESIAVEPKVDLSTQAPAPMKRTRRLNSQMEKPAELLNEESNVMPKKSRGKPTKQAKEAAEDLQVTVEQSSTANEAQRHVASDDENKETKPTKSRGTRRGQKREVIHEEVEAIATPTELAMIETTNEIDEKPKSRGGRGRVRGAKKQIVADALEEQATEIDIDAKPTTKARGTKKLTEKPEAANEKPETATNEEAGVVEIEIKPKSRSRVRAKKHVEISEPLAENESLQTNEITNTATTKTNVGAGRRIGNKNQIEKHLEEAINVAEETTTTTTAIESKKPAKARRGNKQTNEATEADAANIAVSAKTGANRRATKKTNTVSELDKQEDKQTEGNILEDNEHQIDIPNEEVTDTVAISSTTDAKKPVRKRAATTKANQKQATKIDDEEAEQVVVAAAKTTRGRRGGKKQNQQDSETTQQTEQHQSEESDNTNNKTAPNRSKHVHFDETSSVDEATKETAEQEETLTTTTTTAKTTKRRRRL